MSSVLEFVIEFDHDDAVYRPGDTVKGHVIVKLGHSTAVQHLTAMLLGRGQTSTPGKQGEAIKEEVIYAKTEWACIEKPGKAIVEGTHTFAFTQRLPDSLPGSIEGQFGQIRYMIKAALSFVQGGSSITTLSARRAFTVLETNDLNTVPQSLREPVVRSSVKKFGRFSCTGGQVKFTASVGRQAFVAGENVPINGRLENRSNNRVDKASAVLVMITTYLSSSGQPPRTDRFEVSEEALALFVDPGAVIKIERNFALPALVSSTPVDPALLEPQPVSGKRRQQANRRKSGVVPPNQKQPPKPKANFRRIIQVSYELMLRVEVTEDDISDVFVPLIIGNVPIKNKSLVAQAPSSSAPLYRQPRSEKPISISRQEETYACDKPHLMHTNRHPFFADLPTSSKQSRKISTLVTVLKAEKALRKGIVRQARAADLLSNDQDPRAVNFSTVQ
uniref:Arrestin C-terminal-like domain-containing protein n=1 Tax=Plectus sambesii TaxID=2011161 RepID=A0A914V716_9BILA